MFDGPAATFAAELRSARIAAGSPTYRQMAVVGGWSHNGLSQADQGNRLPTWQCTRAYLVGCGTPEDALGAWREKWESTIRAIDLRAELNAVPKRVSAARPGLAPGYGEPQHRSEPTQVHRLAPGLRSAGTSEDLVDALCELIEMAGYTQSKMVERINDPDLRLPFKVAKVDPYQLQEILSQKRRPSFEMVVRIAAACGGTRHDLGEWVKTWQRIRLAEDRALAQLERMKAALLKFEQAEAALSTPEDSPSQASPVDTEEPVVERPLEHESVPRQRVGRHRRAGFSLIKLMLQRSSGSA